MDKDLSKDDKENKKERDKFSLKDLKNKRDEKVREKSSREVKPITKGYRERVDDRTKERDVKQRRYDEKKLYGRREERENMREERRLDPKDDRRYETKEEFRESREKKVEEKRGKSYEKMRQEKKKSAETKKLIADASEEAASPKKVKEAQDNVLTEKGGENSKEQHPAYNGDESKDVGDNECAQHDTCENRVTTANATQDCRDSADEGNGSSGNAGKIYLISPLKLSSFSYQAILKSAHVYIVKQTVAIWLKI